MFGFLYSIAVAIAGIDDAIVNENFKNDSYKLVKESGVDTYYSDSKGRKYYNGEQVFEEYRTIGGARHKVLVSRKNNNIVKDFTDEKNNKIINECNEYNNRNKQEAIKNGEKWYLKKFPKIDGCKYYGTYRFELETDRCYALYKSGKNMYKKEYYDLEKDAILGIEKYDISIEEFKELSGDFSKYVTSHKVY